MALMDHKREPSASEWRGPPGAVRQNGINAVAHSGLADCSTWSRCPCATRSNFLACSTPAIGRFIGSNSPTCTSSEAWSHQTRSCATFPFSNFITNTCGSSTCGRGRDSSYPLPPAQTRAGAIDAHGSYLGCLASKRSVGYGWRTQTSGSRPPSRARKRSQVQRFRWLRRRIWRSQRRRTFVRNAPRLFSLPGTA